MQLLIEYKLTTATVLKNFVCSYMYVKKKLSVFVLTLSIDHCFASMAFIACKVVAWFPMPWHMPPGTLLFFTILSFGNQASKDMITLLYTTLSVSLRFYLQPVQLHPKPCV